MKRVNATILVHTENTTPMAYSKRTNLFQSILFSRGMALAILFAIVFVGFGLVSIAGKSIAASRERKQAEAQAAALSEKNKEMARKLADINTPEGKEAALREQFPVVKPGEHLVVITDPSEQKTSDTPVEKDSVPSGGFWNFLKGLFRKQ